MSFTSEIQKSNSDFIVLIQTDIEQDNTQWVNIGAGIWKVNAENSYPYVDSTLLSGFTAQEFGGIGSCASDGLPLTKVTTLALVTSTYHSFYYDGSSRTIYVSLQNYDEPWLHSIAIGVIYGFSYDEFTPAGSQFGYQGRLLSVPSISQSRDPLFWGRIIYEGGTFSAANADGEYDTWGEDNDVFGNECRVYFGYRDIDIDDYAQIFTGAINTINISEEQVDIEIIDKRAQLTKEITYTSTHSENALTSIKNILVDNFTVEYNTTFFDTTAWAVASALAPNITINMQDTEPAINMIEQICTTVFGTFEVTPTGKFSFTMIDNTATASTTIQDYDIMNRHSLTYDPSEAISSVKIGYNRDWVTSGDQYTYITNTTGEDAFFNKYKTYKQQTFDTLLIDYFSAYATGLKILNYHGDVHAAEIIETPMSYYGLEVSQTANVEINRDVNTMLGSKKSQIMSKSYDLNTGKIMFGIRIV